MSDPGKAGSSIEPFVYLASLSPRRRELLEQMHIAYALLVADADEDAEALEDRRGAETPRAYVRRVTRLKAKAALQRRERRALKPAPILVGDTTVALGQTILGKPIDADDARRMLRELSGRTHRVLSAVAVVDESRIEEALSESRVRFRLLSNEDIDAYIASREPFGKAGAYGIQGRAAAFVEHISGSHSSIVGLPLFEAMQLLHRFGIDPR
jgi:septum formation protein